MLMRLLGGGGVPARAVTGAAKELQRYVGCSEPVLETGQAHELRCKLPMRSGPVVQAVQGAQKRDRGAPARRGVKTRVAGMGHGWECCIGTK